MQVFVELALDLVNVDGALDALEDHFLSLVAWSPCGSILVRMPVLIFFCSLCLLLLSPHGFHPNIVNKVLQYKPLLIGITLLTEGIIK